ncbi:MAG: hypothetical protein LBQ86_09010 [Holophagales bacterium]|jgi:adenine-specific DNA-methyltransferase|nr:hypothetical protein [Holophagales bacterium]
MNNEKLNRFINLLEGIFELDKADLDFGIYRILNIRKKEICKFLNIDLPKKALEALAPSAEDTKAITARIAEIEKQAADLEMEIAAIPKLADEYSRLKSLLAAGLDLSALETDVYSALYNFFNRYYDEGDFISKRRYKEGVYAIPFEGEEVKLYWANADQYYIKTAENFRDYTFIVDDKKVHFRLVEATAERNNNKESNGNGRVFMLHAETTDKPDLKTIEEINGDLIIRFVYDIPKDKKKKYFEENLAAISGAIQKNFPAWRRLFTLAPSSKNESRTLLEKHLSAYAAKNTFDYFIHKDLRGFLTRELDFFIKSEVFRLDDIDTTDEKRAGCYLAKARAIKRVGKVIIDFLSQIEEFQKKLWLKKKFVVETNWCITLDRIDEAFYPEIISNAAQIAEWVEMYAINEISGNLTTIEYSDPLTVAFLRQNRNLVLDTRHFTDEFKDRLVASLDNLDEQTGGLLIHSENFQALQLLREKHTKQIDCIYGDPPYNANSSEILYKNSYKHSSWISLMCDRIHIAAILKSERGAIITAIDENEAFNLLKLFDVMFSDWTKTAVTVLHNPAGVQGDNFSYSHEYAIFLFENFKHVIGKTEKEEKTTEPFRDWGPTGTRNPQGNTFYPVLVDIDGENIIDFGDVCDSNFHPGAQNILKDGHIEIYPVGDEGDERKWVFARDTVENIAEDLYPVNNNGIIQIFRTKSKGSHKTVWTNKRYYANIYGSKTLNNIMGSKKFDFPKSIYTVEDCIYAVNKVQGKRASILDYFAGSGTTGHAVLNLNRADQGNRKYILIEMGEYFNTVTLPRMKKVIYSAEWKGGKPQNRDTGVSHIMKYITLESYEDALSNIMLDDDKHQLSLKFGDEYEYMARYMFDYETRDSMLSLDAFNAPFVCQLKINENNETKGKAVDLCETFNYLLGLSVIRQSAPACFKAVADPNGEYENAVRLKLDKDGEFSFKQIEGKLPDGRRALIIWRAVTKDLLLSNAALDAYFARDRINPADREFDVIFVNGDNNLENLRLDDENWSVRRIEPVFKTKMFEGAE